MPATFTFATNTLVKNTDLPIDGTDVANKNYVDSLAGLLGLGGFIGSQGYTGSAGSSLTGFTGSAGPQGYTGSQGVQGQFGYTGSRGDAGFTGSRGDLGYTGSVGSDGRNIYFGDTPPVSANPGDLWWEAEEGNLFIYYDDYWVQSSIGGAITAGFTGSQGNLGYTGSQGSAGIGYTGSQGDTGFTGSQGDQGIIGYTGSAGTNGTDGYTGSQGTQGIQGFTGSQGDQGVIGYTGSQGDVGYTGSQGDVGYTGSQGATGFTGSGGIADIVSDTTPQLGGDLDAQSTYKIINLVSPSNNGDAANKIYVDSLTQYLADNRLVYIRSGDTNVNSSTDTVLDWNSELVASTIPDFTHSSGVFTNTSTRTRRFLFQMQVAIRAQATAFTEANIWFSFNGTFNSTNRRAQTNFTASTSAVMLTTSWVFTLAQNETVRGYFWCNQASVYGNNQSPPGSSFGNQYSSLIEVQELN